MYDDNRNEIAERFDEWQQRWFKLQAICDRAFLALQTSRYQA